MPDFRPITLNALLSLELEEIEALFPKGAVAEGKTKWRPAKTKKEAQKSLYVLLVEKRKRVEKPTFMLRGSPQPRLRWSKKEKRWVESGDWGVEEHGYTHSASKALDDEGPPPSVVDAYAEESRVTFEQSRTSTYKERLLAEKNQLQAQLDAHREVARERGVDIRSDVRVIEKRLQVINQKLGSQKVAA